MKDNIFLTQKKTKQKNIPSCRCSRSANGTSTVVVIFPSFLTWCLNIASQMDLCHYRLKSVCQVPKSNIYLNKTWVSHVLFVLLCARTLTVCVQSVGLQSSKPSFVGGKGWNLNSWRVWKVSKSWLAWTCALPINGFQPQTENTNEHTRTCTHALLCLILSSVAQG